MTEGDPPGREALAAGAFLRRAPIPWQQAVVERIVDETADVRTYTLRLPQWRPFRPGQHVDVRLTAPDGYQAQRKYSVAASSGAAGTVDLTIERLEEGEVSPFFHEVVEVGDTIEARGPIGGPFTWTADEGGPLLLVGGGSGIVPLMSMLRHRAEAGPDVPALLLFSVRSEADLIYREELGRRAATEPALTVLYTFTRSAPAGWTGYARRVDAAMMAEVVERLGRDAPAGDIRAYVCGPTGFVETAADAAVDAGLPPSQVRTERFGPSGPSAR